MYLRCQTFVSTGTGVLIFTCGTHKSYKFESSFLLRKQRTWNGEIGMLRFIFGCEVASLDNMSQYIASNGDVSDDMTERLKKYSDFGY